MTNEKEVTMADRQPIGGYVALSAAQLEHAGVPPEMTGDELADLIDKALLADDTALQWEIQQWIDERENEDDPKANQLAKDAEAVHEAVQALIRNGAPPRLVSDLQKRRDEYEDMADNMRSAK